MSNPLAGTQLSAREPTYPRYPTVTQIDGTRWFTTHRNWHISSGEADDYGRPPLKAVFAVHDCDDGGHRTFWTDGLQEAVSKIDTMPDYGDDIWDYR